MLELDIHEELVDLNAIADSFPLLWLLSPSQKYLPESVLSRSELGEDAIFVFRMWLAGGSREEAINVLVARSG